MSMAYRQMSSWGYPDVMPMEFGDPFLGPGFNDPYNPGPVPGQPYNPGPIGQDPGELVPIPYNPDGPGPYNPGPYNPGPYNPGPGSPTGPVPPHFGGGTGINSWDPAKHQLTLFSNARNWLNQNPQLWDAYGGEMTAGISPWSTQGAGTAGQVANYQPLNVSAGNVDPTAAQYGGDVRANRVGPTAAQYGGDVSGGSFTSGDWGAYMNPFTQNVVDTTMADIDRSRQIANQQGARSASASTYGGDRNALIEAETNRGYADVAARTSAQLRSQGFDTAAGLMSQDLSRGFQANLANQGMRQNLSQFNAGQRNQTGQFNAGIGLQAGLANQGMRQGLSQFNAGQRNQIGQFNTGIGLQAQGMNQAAGLAGAGLNLEGADALGRFGMQDQLTNQADLDARYNEELRSRFGPLQGYNFLGGLLSGNAYNSQSAGAGGGRGAVGGALAGASAGAAFGWPGALAGGVLGGFGGYLSNR